MPASNCHLLTLGLTANETTNLTSPADSVVDQLTLIRVFVELPDSRLPRPDSVTVWLDRMVGGSVYNSHTLSFSIPRIQLRGMARTKFNHANKESESIVLVELLEVVQRGPPFNDSFLENLRRSHGG